MTLEEREEWLRQRKTCFSGTDMPRVCGVYFDAEDGPANVYREKTSEQLIVSPTTDRMEIGTELEDYAARRFERETGIPLVMPPNNGLVRNQTEPWQGATLDRICRDLGVNAELKCVFSPPGDEWGLSGTDIVPDRVMLQTLWQMQAGGFPFAFVGALFVGYCFRWYRIEADHELIGMLREIAASFWDRVQSQSGIEDWNPPLIETAVARAQRITPGKVVQLGADVSAIRLQHESVTATIKDLEERKSQLKLAVLAAMGDAEAAQFPDGYGCRRKVIHRKEYSVDATSYEDFRFTKPKRGKK